MVALPVDNIDTDQIIPARFLKTISQGRPRRPALQRLALRRRRPAQAGLHPEPAGGPATRPILLAGDNFGCGSSREHAPWALTQFGFRAVISTSFADIFRQNSLKNGILPVVVPPDAHAELLARLARDPAAAVTVDLVSQSVTLPGGASVELPDRRLRARVPAQRRGRAGVRPAQEEHIAAYERQHPPRFDARSG